jgi:NAD(P)H-nitrite reductase large subunit
MRKTSDEIRRAATICRCEDVTLGEIDDAIDEGARTVSEVKWRTRAGMGLCQGKTCRRLVAQLISSRTGIPVSEVETGTYRSPVRPASLGTLAAEPEDSIENN